MSRVSVRPRIIAQNQENDLSLLELLKRKATKDSTSGSTSGHRPSNGDGRSALSESQTPDAMDEGAPVSASLLAEVIGDDEDGDGEAEDSDSDGDGKHSDADSELDDNMSIDGDAKSDGGAATSPRTTEAIIPEP